MHAMTATTLSRTPAQTRNAPNDIFGAALRHLRRKLRIGDGRTSHAYEICHSRHKKLFGNFWISDTPYNNRWNIHGRFYRGRIGGIMGGRYISRRRNDFTRTRHSL